MISVGALVVLDKIASDPSHGAARGISKKLGIGRDKTQAFINELRSAGLLTTTTYRTGIHRFGKVITLTEEGHHVLKTSTSIRTSIQLYEQNSYLILNANSINHYKNIREVNFPKEEKAMDEEWGSLGAYEEDPAEIEELKRRDREAKQEAKRQAKETKYLDKINKAKERAPINRSASHTAYEFGSRVRNLWHVEEWTGDRRPFVSALNNARASYSGNGELEEVMMNNFFDRVALQKHLTNPHIIWKLFIKEYPMLADQARLMLNTKEDIAQEKEAAREQWKKYFNV